jgi:hypothetical protein
MKRVNKKNGSSGWENKGYFSSIKAALKRFADLELFSTGFKDMETISKKQDEIYDLLKHLEV